MEQAEARIRRGVGVSKGPSNGEQREHVMRILAICEDTTHHVVVLTRYTGTFGVPCGAREREDTGRIEVPQYKRRGVVRTFDTARNSDCPTKAFSESINYVPGRGSQTFLVDSVLFRGDKGFSKSTARDQRRSIGSTAEMTVGRFGSRVFANHDRQVRFSPLR